jgi:hypothetical protein
MKRAVVCLRATLERRGPTVIDRSPLAIGLVGTFPHHPDSCFMLARMGARSSAST